MFQRATACMRLRLATLDVFIVCASENTAVDLCRHYFMKFQCFPSDNPDGGTGFARQR